MSNELWCTVYADITAGKAVTESGTIFTFESGCSLFTFLKSAMTEGIRINRLYLCGALPAGYMEWLTSTEMYKFWRTQSRGHVLDGSKSSDYVGRYEHRVTRKKLDIRSVEHWFGDDSLSIFEARGAMLLLTQYLTPFFPLFKHLSGTPATTFSILWEQYNAIEHKKFEVLPEHIRDLLHQTGQGRVEYCEENAKGNIPGLFYYDGIFMYAALTWGLPTEIETHDFKNEFAGKQFARYFIQFRVPAKWNHIGPFGVRTGEKWEYPGLHEQGKHYQTWVDGAELDALVNVYKGTSEDAFRQWGIVIQERIVYKNQSDCEMINPLDSVIKKLRKLRERVEADGKQDAQHERLYQLVRAGIRNLVLHGIGAFNRKPGGTSTYIALASEVPPAGFLDRTELGDGRIVYILPGQNKTSTSTHPEWSACVWGRCRARMFTHAMAVPYENLLAIRTDAIAVSQRMGAWENNTEVGKLRRKWAVEKRLKAPPTSDAFDELQRKIVGKKAKGVK